LARRHYLEAFRPYLAKAILDFVTEGQRRLMDLCICQCDGGVSRSSGIAAALSYILNQDDTWVFNDPRYLPNRLVYRTILDVYYENHPHPPYYRLEKGQGYNYLGSVSLDKHYDLYLYHSGDGDPMVMARYGYKPRKVILGDVDVGEVDGGEHPVLREARRRVDAKGLLDLAFF
jgi:hypothetical protein